MFSEQFSNILYCYYNLRIIACNNDLRWRMLVLHASAATNEKNLETYYHLISLGGFLWTFDLPPSTYERSEILSMGVDGFHSIEERKSNLNNKTKKNGI